jgi:hypothetical protein
MNNVNINNIVVLKKAKMIELPFCHATKEGSSLWFKKGAIGKVTGAKYSNEDIQTLTVEFNLLYGISIQIELSPDCVENASNEQISCYCGYNCQNNKL